MAMSTGGPFDRITRRGFVGLSVAAVLSHLPWGRRQSWPGHGDDVGRGHGHQVTPVFTLSGGATPDGILVHTTLDLTDKGAQVDLAVWRADGDGGVWYAGAQTADQDAIVRHTVTGCEAGTAYYAQVVYKGDLTGERVRFTTLPDSSASWSRRIAVVSCQDNVSDPTNTDLAWDDVLAWAPDDVWHLGDWGYWGGEIAGDAPYTKDLLHYSKSMSLQPSMRKAIQSADLNVVTISDHELTDNGDPAGGIHNAPETFRELTAFQALFPVREYGDTRQPRRGRYYTFDIGTTVRVIVTDFRSPDRSNADKKDSPSKTMFGDVQLAWIFATLDKTRVNVLANETSWLANPNDLPGGKRSDKPWTYFHEQLVIADYIRSGGYRVVWVGGDRHYVGYLRGSDDGTGVYNSRGQFPCYISSGMSKDSLPLQPGELMTWQFGDSHDPDRPVCQYLRLTLSYDAPSRRVTIGAVARAVLDTSQPMSQWQLDDVPGGTASDTWQL